jgi:hypothetical protein
MIARTHADLQNIRRNVEQITKLSDRIIGIGPLGIGLDGILAGFPVAGVVFSAAAAVLLMIQGLRARASLGTLMHMGILLAIDTLIDVPPGAVITAIVDTLFTGHKWAGNVLLKHMDNTVYVEGPPRSLRGQPQFADVESRVRSGKERRRIVFLG